MTEVSWESSGLCNSSLQFDSATNRITSTTGYSYDAAENLLQGGTGTGSISYTWDADGRLTTVAYNGTTTTYTYNGLGQQFEMQTTGSNFSEFCFDLRGNRVGVNNRTSWVTDDIPLGMLTLARYQNNDTYFIRRNHLGSATQVTDHAGNVVGEQVLYPWGAPWLTSGTVTDGLFASQRLPETRRNAHPPSTGSSPLNNPQTWPSESLVRAPHGVTRFPFASLDPRSSPEHASRNVQGQSFTSGPPRTQYHPPAPPVNH